MGVPTKVYAVMRRSGCMMVFRGGLGAAAAHTTGGYLAILSQIGDEMMSAGGEYDAPDKLFLNGKLMVESGLSEMAYQYHRDTVSARQAAAREVQNLHTPRWLPDDEAAPGYNPPGIDAWTVRKSGTPKRTQSPAKDEQGQDQ